MKAIKEKFHKEIAKNYKINLFAQKRKQLDFIQQMKKYYNQIIQNNLEMMLLINKYGYANFYKYCCQIVDNRLLTYVLFNQNNVFKNLQFFENLICLDMLCEISIVRFFFLISNILSVYLQKHKLIKIVQTIKCLLKKQSYHKISTECIKNQRTLDLIFDIAVANQKNSLFYNLIQLYKLTSVFQCMNTSKLVHCFQVHILISTDEIQLYQIYKFLAQIFDILYTAQDELNEYGSIINKMFKDIENSCLVEPISLFLSKGIKNASILKLLIQMKFITNLSYLLTDIYQMKSQNNNSSIPVQNKISIFTQQSLWKLFKILIEQVHKVENQTVMFLEINWKQIKNIIILILESRQIYLRTEIIYFLESVQKISDLNKYFCDLIFRINSMSQSNKLIKQQFQSSFPEKFQSLSLQTYVQKNKF